MPAPEVDGGVDQRVDVDVVTLGPAPLHHRPEAEAAQPPAQHLVTSGALTRCGRRAEGEFQHPAPLRPVTAAALVPLRVQHPGHPAARAGAVVGVEADGDGQRPGVRPDLPARGPDRAGRRSVGAAALAPPARHPEHAVEKARHQLVRLGPGMGEELEQLAVLALVGVVVVLRLGLGRHLQRPLEILVGRGRRAAGRDGQQTARPELAEPLGRLGQRGTALRPGQRLGRAGGLAVAAQPAQPGQRRDRGSELGESPAPFQRQVALRHPGPPPQRPHVVTVEAAGADEGGLHQRLAALLLEGRPGLDEHRSAVGVGPLARGGQPDPQRSVGDRRRQQRQPAGLGRRHHSCLAPW